MEIDDASRFSVLFWPPDFGKTVGVWDAAGDLNILCDIRPLIMPGDSYRIVQAVVGRVVGTVSLII